MSKRSRSALEKYDPRPAPSGCPPRPGRPDSRAAFRCGHPSRDGGRARDRGSGRSGSAWSTGTSSVAHWISPQADHSIAWPGWTARPSCGRWRCSRHRGPRRSRSPAAARREQHAPRDRYDRDPLTAEREHRATHHGQHPRLRRVFRLSARADPVFLLEMLYEAVYWRDDGRDERPPLESLLNDPHHAAYVEGWGRPGDTAVIALRPQRRTGRCRVGAALPRHCARLRVPLRGDPRAGDRGVRRVPRAGRRKPPPRAR